MIDRRRFIVMVPPMLTMSEALIAGPQWFPPATKTIGSVKKRRIVDWDSRTCALPVDSAGERCTWAHCSCKNYAHVDWFERTLSSGNKFKYFSLTVKLGGTTYSLEKIYNDPWKFRKTEKLSSCYDHETGNFA